MRASSGVRLSCGVLVAFVGWTGCGEAAREPSRGGETTGGIAGGAISGAGGSTVATGGTQEIGVDASASGGSPVVVAVTGGARAATGGAQGPFWEHPCTSEQQRAGGVVLCGDGSYRRRTAAACENPLPRAEPAAICHPGDECCADVDCGAAPHGYCSYGACLYGCVEDSECSQGELCFCGDPVGRCVSADCRDNSDCPADTACAAGNSLADMAFICVSTSQCLLDRDCGASRQPRCIRGECVTLPG